MIPTIICVLPSQWLNDMLSLKTGVPENAKKNFIGIFKATDKKRRIRIRIYNPMYRSKDPDPQSSAQIQGSRSKCHGEQEQWIYTKKDRPLVE